MIAWLTNVFDPSPSAQVDVAPSTGGVDPDIRGIKMNTTRCFLWGESARIVRGEHLLGKLYASTTQAKQPFRQDRG